MKTMNFLILIGMTAISGCNSDKEKVPERELYTSVPLFMAGNTIPSDSQEKYLYNPEVKAYSVGRRIDGNGVMHEAGVFYRIEKNPEWNLMPQSDALPKSLMQQELHERYGNVAVGHIQRTIQETDRIKQEFHEALNRQTQTGNELDDLKKKLEQSEKSKVIMAENIKLLKELLDRLEKKMNRIERMPGKQP